MSEVGGRRVVVAGIGNTLRHDDGAGPVVVASLRRRRGGLPAGVRLLPAFCPGPMDLLGTWDTASLAIVVDAVSSSRAPGSVVVKWFSRPGGVTGVSRAGAARSSTHGLGLVDVWEIARSTGTAPVSALFIGIEGADFTVGEGLSPAVEQAVPEAVALALRAVRELTAVV